MKFNKLSKLKNTPLLNSDKHFFLKFTLLFIIGSFFIYFPFIINGKSFIWDLDGAYQHYLSFRYLGTWGREIIRNLLQGRLEIPLWDFSIGLGGDILSSFHYYAFGDVLNLTSVIVPAKYSEIAYGFLVLLRVYLAGLCFSLLAFKMNKTNHVAILAAAFSYMFCGYAVYAGVRHPFFLNPLIYLPLCILGAEKILRKEKPFLFIIIVCISALSNFYFFYMVAIGIVIYVVIRYFTREQEKSFKDFMFVLIKFSLNALLGIGLAAIVFVPVVNILLSSDRFAQMNVAPDLFYGADYYKNFITDMFSSPVARDWVCLGFSAPLFISTVVMFQNRKKYRGLKIAFILFLLMLSFPLVGKVMNGMSYVNNRWSFMLALLMSYIFVSVWEDFFNLSKKSIKIILISTASYLGIIILLKKHADKISFLAIGIMLLFTFILILYNFKIYILSKKVVSAILIFLVCFSSVTVAQEKYSPTGANYISEFIDYDQSLNEDIKNSSDGVLAKFVKNKDTFMRTDQDYSNYKNGSVIAQNNATHFYWSLDNNYIAKLFSELGMPDFIPQKYVGIDERATLSALSSIKYYSKTKNGDTPYGYRKIKEITTEDDSYYKIYKNKYALPLGYTYSSYIDRESYEKMTMIERQQSILQGVVLDDSNIDLSDYEKTQPSYNYQIINPDITLGDKVAKQTDGSYVVNESSGKITLNFEGMENCETYLIIEGVSAEEKTLYELYTDDSEEFLSNEEYEELSTIEKNKIKNSHNTYYSNTKTTSFPIQVKSGKTNKIVRYRDPENWYSIGQKDFTLNLGYSKKGKQQVTLSLPSRGIYKFDNIKIMYQPMDNFASQVKSLKEDIMVNEEITANNIKGEITLREDKILCLSVPYTKGWSAKVDGKDATLLQANTAYMALPLKAGKHTIELHYETPMLRQGVIISLCSLFILVVYYFLWSQKQKRFNNKG